ILDGGTCGVGLESTVIGFEGNEVIVHRLGGLQLEQIEEVIGEKVKVQLNQSSNPSAPGMLKSHYSPGKPVVIGDIGAELPKHENAGVISFNQDFGIKHQVILSPNGDLSEAAAGLFAALRKMKESEVSLILTQKFPDIGLGRAINDRLQRAAAK
ncbi:MAG: Sua5 family C-terminal domain-containing protein, partial [Cyclobacteriaceae bacterium]